MKTTTLTCNTGGIRLDVFIADNISGISRSSAAALVENGHVTVNGIAARKSRKTVSGDIYIITQNEPESYCAAQEDIRLDIVYEDSDIIVINKPKGMVVHPAPGHSTGTLVNALLFHCAGSLSGIGGVLRPGIVHRLDKDTSGLIIAAKNDAAHLSLTSQLASRTLKREYDAIVRGVIKDNSGIIDAPIGRNPRDRKKQAVTDKFSRSAVTRFSVIARFKGFTHLCCTLETGRTHQIRVHMAHIGHPVLGDTVYGRKKAELGMSSQCLHARSLSLIHPSSGKQLSLTTDLPDYFIKTLHKLEHI